jgi:hypothetical protein
MTCAGKMQDVCRENAGRVPGTCRMCAGNIPEVRWNMPGVCRAGVRRSAFSVRFIDFCGFYSYNVISCA